MKLKRFASAVLAGALALSLAACGGAASTSTAASASSAAGSASASAAADGSDLRAVVNGYISIGKVRCPVM